MMRLFADESRQHTTATTHHVVFNGRNIERGFVLIHLATF
jgi:hypothetical protein